MPVGMLDPSAGMISDPPWWQGMTYTDGRIGGARVLDRGGMDTQDWAYDQINHANPMEEFVRAIGQGDLWDRGYTPGSGADAGLFDSSYQGPQYSPELQALLDRYEFSRTGARPGENDSTRHRVAIDRSTGQAAWGNTYGYDRWWEAPLEAAAVLGSAYLGGQLGGSLLGAGGAAEAGVLGAGSAAEAEAMSAALAAEGGGVLSAGALAPAVAPGAPIAASGTLPVASISGTSSLPAMAGSGGGLLGTLGRIAPGAAQWISENPTLARGLFSLGSGLLTSAGSSGGSGGGSQTYGPPKQWTSPLQTGLMSTPERTDITSPLAFKGRW